MDPAVDALRRALAPRAKPAMDAPDSAWNRAAAQGPVGDAFCCRTEWALSYHDVFLSSRPLHIVEADGNVLAFAERVYEAVGRVFEPIESGWMFGSPLLGPRAVELFEAWFDSLPHGERPHGVLVSGLVLGGEIANALWARLRKRFRFYSLDPQTMDSASLAGGYDGWLSRRTGHFRRRLRAAERGGADLGLHFERHVPRSEQEANAIYARMQAVEQRSWKGLGRCGMAEPGSREFYAAMLGRLARAGTGRVVFARREHEDVGFVFGGLAGSCYRGQQFSYVEDLARASIGNLLQQEQLRWLGEEGVPRYDMGPRMDYKRHWTEIETVLHAWMLVPRA